MAAKTETKTAAKAKAEAKTDAKTAAKPRAKRKSRLTPTELNLLVTNVKSLKTRAAALAAKFADVEAKYDKKDGFVPTHIAAAREEIASTFENFDVALEELGEIEAQYNEFFA